MQYRLTTSLLSVFLLAVTVGCDKVSPVAPEGTTLTISASPAQIESPTGTSTITVVARRPNGTPINPGTQIRFDTNLGTIDDVAETDSSGVARAILRGDGQFGTATVRATTGGVAEGATVEVGIGRPAAFISLQPNPTTVPVAGGEVTLLAVVQDASGQPLAGRSVTFSTELGRLESRGGVRQTNASGVARDTLTLTASDLANNPGNVSVSARTVGTDGAAVSDDFQIQIQSDRPEAFFTFRQGSNELQVVFDSTVTGTGPFTYSWNFDDGTSASVADPTHTFPSADTYFVQLTVTNTLTGESDTATASVEVPVDTPGSSN